MSGLRATIAGLAAAVALGPPAWQAAAQGPSPTLPALAPDGHAWAAMSEGEKLRYLEGFLAGQATRQALEQLGLAEVAPDELTRVVGKLRREGKLAYPFAPGLYKTRLEDFFFYRDQRAMPLHEALAIVNTRLRTQGR